MLSFFPRGVLDEILNLIESVSEGFPSYSFSDSLVSMFQVHLIPFNTLRYMRRTSLLLQKNKKGNNSVIT